MLWLNVYLFNENPGRPDTKMKSKIIRLSDHGPGPRSKYFPVPCTALPVSVNKEFIIRIGFEFYKIKLASF